MAKKTQKDPHVLATSDALTPARILIIGNLGYIGPVLTKYLREQKPDAYIVGYDNAYFQGCLINPYLNSEQWLDEQIYGDIRNFNELHLKTFDSVISLAAISNDPMGNVYEKQTLDINAEATFQVAKAAKAVGIKRFVYASSCSVYGAGGLNAKNENSKLNPLTAYAKSKILCEQKLNTISSPNFVVTCLRFATACGASPRLRLDLVLNDFVASAVLNKRIEILSDGTPWRPLINVSDMCIAMEWAIGRSPANGGNFVAVNAGADDWNYTIKDLALAVQKYIPGTDVTINTNAAPDKRSYRVDFSLFKQLAPSHQPRQTLNSTIDELVDTITMSGFSRADFRKSFLMRLNVLNYLREHNRLDDNLVWKA